jgi:diadenosine tetraphosphatase ApaH/serine/threonine PP2A family protein phosphatase
MVHGSPRKPVNEYIFPDDIYTNTSKLLAIFERLERICFVGHTHVPGVFLEDPDFYSTDEINNVYPITDKEKAIINVGSVGQPRDQDVRASYAIVKDDKVEFVRVTYDIEETVVKIIANPELDDFEGERLRDGR